MERFFPRNSGGELRSDAHQSQIIGGNADVDHSQIIGGDTVKLLGGYIPPSPPASAPLYRIILIYSRTFQTLIFIGGHKFVNR